MKIHTITKLTELHNTVLNIPGNPHKIIFKENKGTIKIYYDLYHIITIHYVPFSEKVMLNRINTNLSEYNIKIRLLKKEQNIANIINWCCENDFTFIVEEGYFYISQPTIKQGQEPYGDCLKKEAEEMYGKIFDVGIPYRKDWI